MGYILCTAENSSIAADIACVIGANVKKDGYFIGGRYIVTWAAERFIELALPEEYGYAGNNDIWDREQPQRIEQAYNELPLFPGEFKTYVIKKAEKQFDIIKNLINRRDAEYIIDCGDMGAEGHISQWFIREKADNIKPVKRFCTSSLTDEAIKYSVAHLRGAEEFDNIIIGEYCRKCADWIFNMSVSRCASIKYKARIDIERIELPALFFIVKRYMDVNNFKADDFFQIKASFAGGFSAILKEKAAVDSKLTNLSILTDRNAAEKMAQEIRELKTCIISSVETKKKAVERPRLYDITELQCDANRLYAYTAAEVSGTAQSLYEKHKVITYPRTDSRYITADLQQYVPVMTEYIQALDYTMLYQKSYWTMD